MTANINSILDSYNVIWTTPSQNAGESMPCGGGDVGLNVWVEKGDLLIYLSRSGTFDELGIMPKLGRLRITLDPNPFDDYTSFRQELKLKEGFVQIFAENKQLSARIDVWVDVSQPLVNVEVDASSPSTVSATYESWRLAEREFGKGMEVHAARSWTSAPELGIVRKDVVDFDGDTVRFSHQNKGRNVFNLLVEQQKLTSVKDQMWNPIDGLKYGGSLFGENLMAAGTTEGKYASTHFRGWKLVSQTPAKLHHVKAFLDPDALPKNRGRSHTFEWWRTFWDRSYIFINADHPHPNDPAWQVGRNYQLFRYQLGCNAYGKYPTKFNGGLFTYDPEYVDPNRAFNPDFRMWTGSGFTAQNQRLVYWPMLKSGDFDMMTPQFEFYRNALGNAELRSQVYFGFKAACFSEQIECFGLPISFEYGWKRNRNIPDGVEDNLWVNHQWDTVFEFCLMILHLRDYTGQDISRYIPLIESCLSFYDNFYRMRNRERTGKELSDDGKLVIFPGTALETYKNALNPVSTIAALIAVLDAMIQLPDAIKTDKQRWVRMRQTIPAITFREQSGHKTISPAVLWTHIQNCELPQLYPVYPYGLYGLGKTDLDVAINTWKYGNENPDQKQIISWHQDAIFCARLGLTDEARDLTIQKMKDSGRRFPTFWGPGHDWVPDHNWGGSGMIGLQEMVVQEVDGKIHVLPAFPREWDVKFKLHLSEKTTIEGEMVDGKSRITVSPDTRQTDLN